MNTDPARLAATYFDAWRAKDPQLLRPALAEDVQFIGPLAQVSGADAYTESIQGLYEITTELDVKKVLADEEDALTWFDLHTSVAPPVPVANWCHARDGKIAVVRVAFDPRGMVGGAPS
ncbi:MAG TPA: nuclear transport factor 2 family protein [Solirubrobacteraceae bacterium]